MRVTRKMLHPDLQPYFHRAMAIRLSCWYKWLTKFINKTLLGAIEGKNIDSLTCDETYIPSVDGQYNIRTRIYRPKQSSPNLPVMVYIHGGGYITGNPEMTHSVIEKFIQTRPCVVVSPSYRTAYTKPYPAAFNDCYDTLLWVKKNAEQLGVSTDKVIVAGHSGGGGLTAAVTLKARDTGDVKIAFQMPFYPMIDDRQPTDPVRYIEAPVWDSRSNSIGWDAYLSDLRKTGAEIPAYAAAARNSDYRDLPPTMTFVGTLEPFYEETCQYVAALKKEGVDVVFEEFEGCFHGFEVTFPKADISKKARDYTFGQYAAFYDRYVG